MGNLYEELKRRKVFRIAAVYAVLAWLIIQVTSTVLPTFGAPDWINQTIILLLILGFPVALVFAWAFELTPDGIRADSDVQTPQNSTPVSDQKLIYTILVLLVLVVGLQITDRTMSNSESDGVVASSPNGLALNQNTASNRVVRSNLIVRTAVSRGMRVEMSLSPDGYQMAYMAHSDQNELQLELRSLDQLEPRLLGRPFENQSRIWPVAFSPDGQWIAAVDGGKLKRVSVSSGAEQQIAADVPIGDLGLSWLDNETLLVFLNSTFGTISASGGKVETPDMSSIYPPNSEVRSWAKGLPDGKSLIFTRWKFPDGAHETGTVELYDLETNETQVLLSNAYNATYSPTGHLVFMRQGSLWGVPFDLGSRSISGDVAPLVDNVARIEIPGIAFYTLSESGNLVYVTGNSVYLDEQKSTLAWVDRAGIETPLEMVPQIYNTIGLSPDESRVAVSIRDENSIVSDVWSYAFDRGTLSRITFASLVEGHVWNNDGSRLIYGSREGILSANANGTGGVEMLLSTQLEGAKIMAPNTISSDGEHLLYSIANTENADIFILSPGAEQQPDTLLHTGFNESRASLAPNGRWVAYVSNETGRNEVYVRTFPDIETGKWQVSANGGSDPQWARDTGELFYRRETESGTETYSVDVGSGDEFSARAPQLLFTSNHLSSRINSYAVNADGTKFLMRKPVADANATISGGPTNLVLVENFAVELQRLLPAGTHTR